MWNYMWNLELFFEDLTSDLRLRRERCAHAALKRLVLGKHHVS